MDGREIKKQFSRILRYPKLETDRHEEVKVTGNNLLYSLTKHDENINESGIENLGTDWMLLNMGQGNFKFSRRWAWIFRHYIWASRVPSFEQRRARLVDIGCDVGEIRKLISKSFYTKNPLYVGIDLDHRRLEQGAERIQMKIPAVYIQEDVTLGLHFIQSHSIDLIFCGEIIEHFSKKFGIRMLKEMYRILKPGASFLLSTPNRDNTKGFKFHVYEYSIPELKQLISKCGFEITNVWGWTTTERRILQGTSRAVSKIYSLLKESVHKDIVVPLMAFIDPSISEAFCIEAKKPELPNKKSVDG